MANLKSGTLIGGNMIWNTGNMPFQYTGGTLTLDGNKVYTTKDKPTPDELGVVNKAGDVMTGRLNVFGSNTDTSQVRVGASTHKAVMATSATVGEFIFGGTADGGNVITDYLRVGRNKIQYWTNEIASDIYHTRNKPTPDAIGALPNTLEAEQVIIIDAPAGVVDGKFYPLVISEIGNRQRVYLNTRSSSGSDPMNNCSFDGIVRGGGWSDQSSYAVGQFSMYNTDERAIHSVITGAESVNFVVFYVEARAFPVVVRVGNRSNVKAYGQDTPWGTTTLKAGISLSEEPSASDYGTKVIILENFNKGSGYYTNNVKSLRLESKGVIKSTVATGTVLEANTGKINTYRNDLFSVDAPEGFAFVTGHTGSALCTNAYYDGVWKKYNNAQPSHIFSFSNNVPSYRTSAAGDTDPTKLSYKFYHEGFKPTPADIDAYTKSEVDQLGKLRVLDVRGEVRNPNFFDNQRLTAWFNNEGMPNREWYSGITVKGWESNYVSWQLFSSSHTNTTADNRLYFRAGNNSSWNSAYEVYHSGRKPTPDDLGVVNKAGDTMTGKLTISNSLETTNAITYYHTTEQQGLTLSTNTAGKYSEVVRIGANKNYEWGTGIRCYGGTDWRIGTDKIFHQGFKTINSNANSPLELEGGSPCLTFNETDTGKKYYFVADGNNIRLQEDSTGSKFTAFSWFSSNKRLQTDGHFYASSIEGSTPFLGQSNWKCNFVGADNVAITTAGRPADSNQYPGVGVHANGNIYMWNHKNEWGYAATISGVDFSVNRNLFEKGNRVYSAGNKPSPSDLGLGTGNDVNFRKVMAVNDSGEPHTGVVRESRHTYLYDSGGNVGIWSIIPGRTNIPLIGRSVSNGHMRVGDNIAETTLYGTKILIPDNGIEVKQSSTSWLDMRSHKSCFKSTGAVNTSSAGVIVRQEHADRYFMVGGLGNSHFGFFMINKSRTTNGTDAGAYLSSNGEWKCDGNGSFNDVYIRSDARLKTDLTELTSNLDKVLNLKPYEYTKKATLESEDTFREIGLIAQDVEEIIPLAVNTDENGMKSLKPYALIATLIGAIQELKAEIDELKSK
ncbi:MAG: tail fiber domain-containing protein [Bacilli bacterium]